MSRLGESKTMDTSDDEETAAALELLQELREAYNVEMQDAGGAPLGRTDSPIGSDQSDTDQSALEILREARAAFAARREDEEEFDEEMVEDEGEDDADDDGNAGETYMGTLRNAFSPFSTRGNWTLHGVAWEDAMSRHGIPLVERVVELLAANPWCWRLDFSQSPDPSSTWFHLTPDTVTPYHADVLARKVTAAIIIDSRKLASGCRLPESQQPRDRFMFVQEFTYLWNISRGWCAGPCRCADAPLQFSAIGRVGRAGVNGDWSHVGAVWSAQRRYNECLHQKWNISGVLHNACNGALNSHPFRCFNADRVTEPNLPPFQLSGAGGGVSGHWADQQGSAISLTFDPNKPRSANLQRLRKWLASYGYKHSTLCNNGAAFQPRLEETPQRDPACPYCCKRVELLQQLGPLPAPPPRAQRR